MTQETKPAPVPHIHAAIIGEWVKDTTRAVQTRESDAVTWLDCEHPHWHADAQYRFKPRWFDMKNEWIAKGKPEVEALYRRGWEAVSDPAWNDGVEYRFKEVSRHAALKAEWEAKGRPDIQFKDDGSWKNTKNPRWSETTDYRIKPTPHPNADLLRALADDCTIPVRVDRFYFDAMGNVTKFLLSEIK